MQRYRLQTVMLRCMLQCFVWDTLLCDRISCCGTGPSAIDCAAPGQGCRPHHCVSGPRVSGPSAIECAAPVQGCRPHHCVSGASYSPHRCVSGPSVSAPTAVFQAPEFQPPPLCFRRWWRAVGRRTSCSAS